MQATGRQPCAGQRAPDGAPVHCERHRPEETTLYRLVQQHAATFFAQAEDAAGADLPQFVKDEFEAFLECGILAHGLPSACGPARRYWNHGVLAPNAKLRAQVVPQEPEPPAQATQPAECKANCAHHRPVRLSRAKLLKRVFEIDIEHCPNCGGELQIIAAILRGEPGRKRS
ncbi:MAG: hypothetical protein Q8R98_19680 [Rubrivivax sp.]|nr:hypothetical protein [Rubrivivax sp.]